MTENYREIITKAVCGKGQKLFDGTHTISPLHEPSSILGCWIINHSYSAIKKDDDIEVQGSYDINVWYSYENNTKTDVVTENVSYTDTIPLSTKDDNVLTDEMDVIATAIKQPNALEATISESGEEVNVDVEREFAVECIGETKVAVAVDPDGLLEEVNVDADEDQENAQVPDEQFDRLNPNFLQSNPNR